MGKQNQPRVKGNMKPASSSRAAELAGMSGNAFSLDNLGGFAQFAGSATNNVIAQSSTPTLEIHDSLTTQELDPELVVIIKKISKRDTVTKVKALEELETYLKANNQTTELVLNTWVGLYAKLVLEVDRRVRLSANQVHCLITVQVKKKLAPLLKNVIGPWLLSMHDQSRDIANLAKGSFETMFAVEKRIGVISFCQKEILDYLTDMLLYKTAETLSDARYVNKEEMMAKYARVVSSSFQILSYLISELPITEKMKNESEYNIILDSTTLWKKFAAHNNPLIRNSFYHFVKTLLLNWKDTFEDRLALICPNFFAAVFSEKEPFTHSEMWDALLLLTKNFPNSWIIIGRKKPSLPKLYSFLKSGLNGSVAIAYPSLIALLANLPQEMRDTDNFYNDMFDSFWKGLSTGFIEKSNFKLFYDAYIECIIYFTITLSKLNDQSSDQISNLLIQDKLWNAINTFFLGSRDKELNEKIDPSAYKIVSKHLTVLSNIESTKDLSRSLWNQLDQLFIQTVVDCNSVVSRDLFEMSSFSQKTSNFLVCLSQEPKKQVLEETVDGLARRLLCECLGSSIVHKDKSDSLITLAGQLVKTYGATTGDNASLAGAVKQLFSIYYLDKTPAKPLTSLIVSIIVRMNDKKEASLLWKDFLDLLCTLCEQSETIASEVVFLALEQIKEENATDFDFCDEKLDLTIQGISESLNTDQAGSSLENAVCSSLIHSFSYHVLSNCAIDVILLQLRLYLKNFNQGVHSVPALTSTVSTLNIMEKLMKDDRSIKALPTKDSFVDIPSQLLDAIFTSQKSYSHYDDTEEAALYQSIQSKSAIVWESISATILSDHSELAFAMVKQLKKSILDIGCMSSPSDSVQRVEKLLSSRFFTKEARIEAFQILIGTKEEWDHLLEPFSSHTTDYLTLSVVDPYVALSVEYLTDDEGELMPTVYDVYGLSSLGRLALFWGEYLCNPKLLELVFDNKKNDWLLYQLMAINVACGQGLSVPNTCRIWEKKATEGIRVFVKHINDLFSNWMCFVARSDCHSQFNEKLISSIYSQQQCSFQSRLISFAKDLVLSSKNLVLCANITQMLFSQLLVLNDWPVPEVQKWLPLLKAEATELDLLIKASILRALKQALRNTDAYRSYQSDLCSKLSSASSLLSFDYTSTSEDKKSKQYWSLLGLLNASSLKSEAFDIPRQRVMHLIQSTRQLLQNSFDLSSSEHKARVQAQLASLLKNLAQSVPDETGGHWDYFLKSCFTWTAYTDVNQPDELLVSYSALDLYQTLIDLSQDNDVLYETVKAHLPSYGKLLLEQAAKEYGKGGVCKVRTLYQQVLSNLLGHISDKTLLETDRFSDLCQLIITPNEQLQKCSYSLLKKMVAQKVEDLSVRLEFTETSEEETHIKFDTDLMAHIMSPPDLSEWQNVELDGQHHEMFGYLLAWMLILDHFNDITFKLKQEYTAELKEKEAFGCLMPVLCSILNVGQRGAQKPFDLTHWNIMEYDYQGFNGRYEVSFYVLASHLYYRSLRSIPSLARVWWIDCKNRQLTLAVESYTEKHFSQPIINEELEMVNRPDIKSQLEENEENEFTIKTLKAASEVTAKYVVDEQDMQIAIKLPSNYPLRQIEVEGVQKVGVNDKQWRGWMFSITAVIGSQNGNIVDALTVFKRNSTRSHYTHQTM
ncbi:hypothetical protein BY458DRAFT_555169 [Sporodiniella umbellata]|nr:hypothetical protein BY458DRAFT_555169 [Sporodiniella umbellata]